MAFFSTVCVLSYTSYDCAYKCEPMPLCYSFLISFLYVALLCRTKAVSGYENVSACIAKLPVEFLFIFKNVCLWFCCYYYHQSERNADVRIK